jgi:signal transduction histidine kinase
MSAPAPARPDPRLLAVFGVVAWIAVVVAAFGMLSLLLDVDVIAEPQAGPLLGPVMVVAAAVVLGLLLVRIQKVDEGPGVSFVGATAAVYLTLLLVGGVGFTAITADLSQLLFFPFAYCASPFVLSAAVAAGLTALAVLATAGRGERGGRPRWPWENRREP